MVSICIPLYNCDLNDLIHEVLQQFQTYNIDYEIIVIDDFSLPEFKQINEFLYSRNEINYIELRENVGRSAIRNMFAEHARYNKLLFLDCDSRLNSETFIKTYMNMGFDGFMVVCGGRIYNPRPKQTKYLLRWKYGIYRECKMANERNKNPWHSFMTNNFLIDRITFMDNRFDTRLKGYGHEDSFFGYQLKCKKILVKHIDNQTIHVFNETSKEFLGKTKQSIKNLFFIHSCLLPNGEFSEMIKLLKTFEKVKGKRMSFIFSILSYPVLPFIALLFRIGIVQLWVFDIYKLLYLCRISQNENLATEDHLA